AAADLPEDAKVAQLFRAAAGATGCGRPEGEPGGAVAAGGDLLHHYQGREQVADLLGVLRVALDVLAQRGPLPAAVPLEELLGQLLHGRAGRRGRIHERSCQAESSDSSPRPLGERGEERESSVPKEPGQMAQIVL